MRGKKMFKPRTRQDLEDGQGKKSVLKSIVVLHSSSQHSHEELYNLLEPARQNISTSFEYLSSSVPP